MSHEKLKWMKDSLICVVENQLCNLNEVDTEELGDAIDMIKDLEEAIYYCTVTEAMNKQGHEMSMEMKKGDHQQKPEDDRMYYNGGYPAMYAEGGRRRRADGTFYAEGGQSGSDSGQNYVNGGQSGSGSGQNYAGGNCGGQGYAGGGQNYMYADSGMPQSGNSPSSRNYYGEPMWRDEREGRSPMSRRMYMEAKHMNKDKATQLRELEKYMQELSQDVTEMIADASPEEKQYLEKKITALAAKIGQMK